jgi:site-specific DNA recombinase
VKVAIYARVSSEGQAARGTIGSQLEVLASRTAAEGHQVVATYTDDGYSGARLDRPGLDALRDAAEAGAFEVVWCLSPDRLARSFPYQVLILDELAHFGVTVAFTDSPPIDDDPQARLLIEMQGVISEYEKAKMAERYRRGKLYRMRAGEAIFWKVAYGYRRIARSEAGPAHLEVYQPEAEVVRRIFSEYLEGTSLRQIARHLYEDGVLTATGKPLWRPATIAGMLHNRAYAGTAVWYRHDDVVRPGQSKRRRRLRPQEDWVEVPVPAIISEAVFAAAQAVTRDNSIFSPRHSTPGLWLLRGLVVCGPCGVRAHVHQSRSTNGHANRYYDCSNHDPFRAGGPDRRCTERQVRADELDAFVFDQVRKVLLRPEVLMAGEAALAGKTKLPDDELCAAQLERLARRADQVDAERRRLADLYQAGLVELGELRRRSDDVAARKARLERERAELTARQQELAVENRLRHCVSDFAAQVTSGIDNLDFDGRQRLLRLVVEQVRVTGWHVEIRLRIPLNDGPTDDRGNQPNTPSSPSPTRNSRRQGAPRKPVSSDVRLRSAGQHQQGVIAPSRPGGPVRCGHEGIRLVGCEEVDLGAVVSLGGNRQDSLDQRGVLGMTQSGVVEQGSDGSQASVAGAGAVVAIMFEMGQEGPDQFGVDVGYVQLGRGRSGAGLGEGEQHPKRVTVGGDSARAGLALAEQAIGEPGLDCRGERGHGLASSKRSRRSAAKPRSSVEAWR